MCDQLRCHACKAVGSRPPRTFGQNPAMKRVEHTACVLAFSCAQRCAALGTWPAAGQQWAHPPAQRKKGRNLTFQRSRPSTNAVRPPSVTATCCTLMPAALEALGSFRLMAHPLPRVHLQHKTHRCSWVVEEHAVGRSVRRCAFPDSMTSTAGANQPKTHSALTSAGRSVHCHCTRVPAGPQQRLRGCQPSRSR